MNFKKEIIRVRRTETWLTSWGCCTRCMSILYFSNALWHTPEYPGCLAYWAGNLVACETNLELEGQSERIRIRKKKMEGEKEGRKNLVSSCWARTLWKETSRKISEICQCVASALGLILRVCVWSLSHVQFFATPWTAAHQAALSMGYSRQEYWSGLPLPSPWSHSNSSSKSIIFCLFCAYPVFPPVKTSHIYLFTCLLPWLRILRRWSTFLYLCILGPKHNIRYLMDTVFVPMVVIESRVSTTLITSTPTLCLLF